MAEDIIACPSCNRRFRIKGEEESNSKNDLPASGVDVPSGEESLLPGYEMEGILGKSKIGTTYLARNIAEGTKVVIKLINLPMDPSQKTLKRFLSSVQSLSRLSIKGVLKVIDTGEINGKLYVVRPYVEGATLTGIFEKRSRMPLEKAASIVLQMLEILKEIHQGGIVHHNLRPSNVVIGPRGDVTLVDLGEWTFHRALREGKIFRQPNNEDACIAPEMIHKYSTADKKADIYSVGAFFHRMLVGSFPVDGISSALEDSNEISSDVARFIRRMCVKEPARRMVSAEVAISELRTVLQKSTTETVTIYPDGETEYSLDAQPQWTTKWAHKLSSWRPNPTLVIVVIVLILVAVFGPNLYRSLKSPTIDQEVKIAETEEEKELSRRREQLARDVEEIRGKADLTMRFFSEELSAYEKALRSIKDKITWGDLPKAREEIDQLSGDIRKLRTIIYYYNDTYRDKKKGFEEKTEKLKKRIDLPDEVEAVVNRLRVMENNGDFKEAMARIEKGEREVDKLLEIIEAQKKTRSDRVKYLKNLEKANAAIDEVIKRTNIPETMALADHSAPTKLGELRTTISDARSAIEKDPTQYEKWVVKIDAKYAKITEAVYPFGKSEEGNGWVFRLPIEKVFPSDSFSKIFLSEKCEVLVSIPGKGIYLWKAFNSQRALEPEWKLKMEGEVLAWAYSPLRDRLATARGRTVVLYQLPSTEPMFSTIAHSGRIECIAFDPKNGERMATGDRNRSIVVWNKDKKIATLDSRISSPDLMGFPPIPNHVFCSYDNKEATLWNYITQRRRSTIKQREQATAMACSSPNYFVTGSAKGYVTVRSYYGQEKFRKNLHRTKVSTVTISADGMVVASGDSQGRVMVVNWRRSKDVFKPYFFSDAPVLAVRLVGNDRFLMILTKKEIALRVLEEDLWSKPKINYRR